MSTTIRREPDERWKAQNNALEILIPHYFCLGQSITENGTMTDDFVDFVRSADASRTQKFSRLHVTVSSITNISNTDDTLGQTHMQLREVILRRKLLSHAGSSTSISKTSSRSRSVFPGGPTSVENHPWQEF